MRLGSIFHVKQNLNSWAGIVLETLHGHLVFLWGKKGYLDVKYCNILNYNILFIQLNQLAIVKRQLAVRYLKVIC